MTQSSDAPRKHASRRRSWRLLTRAWRALDRQLLLRYPHLWAMRFHHALAFSVGATALFAFLAWRVPVAPSGIPNTYSLYLLLSAPCALALFTWSIVQFRTLRHVSLRGSNGGGRTFLLYLLCAGAIQAPALVAVSCLEYRVAAAIPETKLRSDSDGFDAGLRVVGSAQAPRRYLLSVGEEMPIEAEVGYFCTQPASKRTVEGQSIDLGGSTESSQCEEAWPPPDVYLDDSCRTWVLDSPVVDHGTMTCDVCDETDPSLMRLAEIVQRYGCIEASENLRNAKIALGLHEKSTPTYLQLFYLWLGSVMIATVLTVLRTTSVRVLIEVGLLILAVWILMNFLGLVLEAQLGNSQMWATACCVAGLLVIPFAALARPRIWICRLLLASCLLAPVVSIAWIEAVDSTRRSAILDDAAGKSRRDPDVDPSKEDLHATVWFTVQGRSLSETLDVFVGVRGFAADTLASFLLALTAGTATAFLFLVLYRVPAQRLASLPAKR